MCKAQEQTFEQTPMQRRGNQESMTDKNKKENIEAGNSQYYDDCPSTRDDYAIPSLA